MAAPTCCARSRPTSILRATATATIHSGWFFPILDADGPAATTDLLFAERVFTGDKPDLISMFWDPAKPGICRVHAIWRVTDGKAALVFWGEAADCSSNKPEFKTVLDSR